MPVWLRYKGWVFTVPIGDSTLRPHVHIQKGRQELKVWLDDQTIARNIRVKSKDARELVKATRLNQTYLMERWNDQFS